MCKTVNAIASEIKLEVTGVFMTWKCGSLEFGVVANKEQKSLKFK